MSDSILNGGGPVRVGTEVLRDFALAEHREVEPAIDALVRSHLRLVAASGFVTGLGGFAALPVALPANVLGFLPRCRNADGRGHRLDPRP